MNTQHDEMPYFVLYSCIKCWRCMLVFCWFLKKKLCRWCNCNGGKCVCEIGPREKEAVETLGESRDKSERPVWSGAASTPLPWFVFLFCFFKVVFKCFLEMCWFAFFLRVKKIQQSSTTPSLHCRRAKGNQLLTWASRLALQTLVRRQIRLFSSPVRAAVLMSRCALLDAEHGRSWLVRLRWQCHH